MQQKCAVRHTRCVHACLARHGFKPLAWDGQRSTTPARPPPFPVASAALQVDTAFTYTPNPKHNCTHTLPSNAPPPAAGAPARACGCRRRASGLRARGRQVTSSCDGALHDEAASAARRRLPEQHGRERGERPRAHALDGPGADQDGAPPVADIASASRAGLEGFRRRVVTLRARAWGRSLQRRGGLVPWPVILAPAASIRIDRAAVDPRPRCRPGSIVRVEACGASSHLDAFRLRGRHRVSAGCTSGLLGRARLPLTRHRPKQN
eukprot:353707-Chlamydomonas_euryale.AAC.20